MRSGKFVTKVSERSFRKDYVMADNFMKLTIKNQQQIDALKKIGSYDFGVNGGNVVMNGTDISIFQGDVENFKQSELGYYSPEQLEAVFAVLDTDGNGDLSSEELKAFAAMGEDESNIIENDKSIIDETDFEALYEMAQGYVDDALKETGTTNTKPSTNTNVDINTTIPETKPQENIQVQEPEISAEETVIGDNEALAAAQELRTAMAGLGTDEKAVSKVLMESGYSTADIVKIMDVFENQYGETLMNDIQNDYSGKAETELRNVLYNSAANEAMKALGWQSVEDIPSDIAQKANEFYSELESNNALGYMKDFDKLSDSEKAQILVACDMLHSNDSAINRVTEGMAWFGKEDGYVDGMITALKNTAGVKESEQTQSVQKETTTADERATIGDNEASAKAAELRNAMAGLGTDEKAVSKILMESGYSTADIVKIMDSFEEQYDESLMSDIQGDYSGKAETELRNILFNSAANEAMQTLGWQSVEDIPTDIAQKANELYSQLESADATGYMKDFTKMSESEQAEVMLACDLLHPGESVMDRLTQDRAWFGKEDGYVDGIISGMKKVANTKIS